VVDADDAKEEASEPSAHGSAGAGLPSEEANGESGLTTEDVVLARESAAMGALGVKGEISAEEEEEGLASNSSGTGSSEPGGLR
jgi:hypothetical protein